MDNLFNTGIRPEIDKYLKQQQDKVRDYGKYWSASSAGYCMRKNLFERLGVPKIEKEGDERLTRVFEAGHIFHEWVQRITKNAKLSIAQEIELKDEVLMIKGHIDDLILKDDKLILYDYKTQHSKAFHWAKGKPMSHYHRMQLGTYMMMIRNSEEPWYKHNGPLTEARIMKISKDDLCFSEQELLWSKELEQEVVDYWTTLNEHLDNGTIPVCTCAEKEGGFMAKEAYNPFFYNGEPCSLEYYKQWKELTNNT